MAQTAVEWLIEKLDNNLDIKHSWRTKQYIDQAQKMEKQQAERMYSEEDLRKSFHVGRLYQGREGDTTFNEWFEQFKKK